MSGSIGIGRVTFGSGVLVSALWGLGNWVDFMDKDSKLCHVLTRACALTKLENGRNLDCIELVSDVCSRCCAPGEGVCFVLT